MGVRHQRFPANVRFPTSHMPRHAHPQRSRTGRPTRLSTCSPNANLRENKLHGSWRTRQSLAYAIRNTWRSQKSHGRLAELLVRPPVNLHRFISLTKTSEHRACTHKSHGPNQAKCVKVTEILHVYYDTYARILANGFSARNLVILRSS